MLVLLNMYGIFTRLCVFTRICVFLDYKIFPRYFHLNIHIGFPKPDLEWHVESMCHLTPLLLLIHHYYILLLLLIYSHYN
jgi:hypothetical protein